MNNFRLQSRMNCKQRNFHSLLLFFSPRKCKIHIVKRWMHIGNICCQKNFEMEHKICQILLEDWICSESMSLRGTSVTKCQILLAVNLNLCDWWKSIHGLNFEFTELLRKKITPSMFGPTFFHLFLFFWVVVWYVQTTYSKHFYCKFHYKLLLAFCLCITIIFSNSTNKRHPINCNMHVSINHPSSIVFANCTGICEAGNTFSVGLLYVDVDGWSI